MVRKIHKAQKISGVLIATMMPLLSTFNVSAARNDTKNIDFNVDVTEVLTVSLTRPDEWAAGDIDSTTGQSDLLRNKIILNVLSNNAAGFTASMASKTTTNLVNQTEGKSSVVIPTLAATTTAENFPVNRWGYSVNDTDAGSSSASYSALDLNAITIANPNYATTLNQPIYFGAKAGMDKDSGTYANTVVISVVSGVISESTNPVTPVNPVVPEDTSVNNPSYDSVEDRTVKTSTTTGNQSLPVATTTTTERTDIATGDVRTAFASPQGVTTASSTVEEGTPMVTGLMVTAGVAAAAGSAFFMIAKFKK